MKVAIKEAKLQTETITKQSTKKSKNDKNKNKLNKTKIEFIFGNSNKNIMNIFVNQPFYGWFNRLPEQ